MQTKYLIFDFPILNGQTSENAGTEGDLLLGIVQDECQCDNCKGKKYRVLKNGVQFVQDLNELTKYGYHVVFCFANKNKAEQLQFLDQLRIACSKKGIMFPQVEAMVVYDSEHFPEVTGNNPTVLEDREHGIRIAGYGSNNMGATTDLCVLSKLLGTKNKNQRKNQYIFHNDDAYIARAKKLGYQTYRIGYFSSVVESMSLQDAVSIILHSERVMAVSQNDRNFFDTLKENNSFKQLMARKEAIDARLEGFGQSSEKNRQKREVLNKIENMIHQKTHPVEEVLKYIITKRNIITVSTREDVGFSSFFPRKKIPDSVPLLEAVLEEFYVFYPNLKDNNSEFSLTRRFNSEVQQSV